MRWNIFKIEAVNKCEFRGIVSLFMEGFPPSQQGLLVHTNYNTQKRHVSVACALLGCCLIIRGGCKGEAGEVGERVDSKLAFRSIMETIVIGENVNSGRVELDFVSICNLQRQTREGSNKAISSRFNR